MKIIKGKRKLVLLLGILIIVVILFLIVKGFIGNAGTFSQKQNTEVEKEITEIPPVLTLDTVLYDKKMVELANNPIPPTPKPIIKKVKDPKTGKITEVTMPAPVVTPKPNIWPAKTVYPNAGAILPFNRVVAYYGNLYSKKMGALGEYPEEEMLAMLQAEVKKWTEADPTMPAIPALHYVVVTAQGSAGEDGKYRLRMPDKEIEKVLAMAKKIDAIVFLDVQVGFSNLSSELPLLEKYLKMPQVHLGIDPEFSMKGDKRPGKVVGTFYASDINYAAEYLAKVVKDNNLTPKILVVHRYIQNMVTNYQEVKPLSEVQIVMDMDGWGGKDKKLTTYRQFIYKEPVQFTGFKIFYKNDTLEKGTVIFTPPELLKLNPRPIYIQYQ